MENKIYVVNVYSIDVFEVIQALMSEYFTKTLAEAMELKKIIYQKLVDLQLSKEYYIEVEESEFKSLDAFDERKELDYLYSRREFLDKKAKEEQERIQRIEDEYNSLTDKQKEIYDANMIDISKWNLDKVATDMNGMFSECKDFHTIAMEKAKSEDLH